MGDVWRWKVGVSRMGDGNWRSQGEDGGRVHRAADAAAVVYAPGYQPAPPVASSRVSVRMRGDSIRQSMSELVCSPHQAAVTLSTIERRGRGWTNTLDGLGSSRSSCQRTDSTSSLFAIPACFLAQGHRALLDTIPAVIWQKQGTTWTCRQFITGQELTISSSDDVLMMVELKKKKNRSPFVHRLLFLSEEMGEFNAIVQELEFYPLKLLQ